MSANAWQMADAVVRILSGLLVLGFVAYLIYATFFRKRKK
jgi:hypothetical protein